MSRLRSLMPVIALLLLAAPAWPQDPAEGVSILEPGKRFTVNDTVYGVCEFTQKPQIGMVVLKVQLFDQNDVQVTPYAISGSSGMPSMPGHHDSGEVPLKRNRFGNYLLPVNVVMPGDWEIRLVFRDGERIVFQGAIRFDV